MSRLLTSIPLTLRRFLKDHDVDYVFHITQFLMHFDTPDQIKAYFKNYDKCHWVDAFIKTIAPSQYTLDLFLIIDQLWHYRVANKANRTIVNSYIPYSLTILLAHFKINISAFVDVYMYLFSHKHNIFKHPDNETYVYLDDALKEIYEKAMTTQVRFILKDYIMLKTLINHCNE